MLNYLKSPFKSPFLVLNHHKSPMMIIQQHTTTINPHGFACASCCVKASVVSHPKDLWDCGRERSELKTGDENHETTLGFLKTRLVFDVPIFYAKPRIWGLKTRLVSFYEAQVFVQQAETKPRVFHGFSFTRLYRFSM